MNKKAIEKIINSGYGCSMAITGGGMSAIGSLTKYGGASKFLVSAHVPYSKIHYQLFTQKNRNDDFVSLEACEELTQAAQKCAGYLYKDKEKVIGLGVTAKLTYEGERENREHEAYIGIMFGDDKYAFYRVNFLNNLNRETQEKSLDDIILGLLYKSLGYKDNISKSSYRHLWYNVLCIKRKGL